MVTGGSGFIGSAVVKNLMSDGHRVINIDIKNGHDAKSRDEILHDINIVDVIVNCAVRPLPESIVEPRSVVDENIAITMNLLEILREMQLNVSDYKVPSLLHISSSEVYGTCEGELLTEENKMSATTPYAASKAACDQLVESYSRTYGITTSIIRPFNTYGPGQNDNTYAAVVPITIKRIISGRCPVLNGTGNQSRDFNFVGDIAAGIVCAVDELHNRSLYNGAEWIGPINLSTGKNVKIKHLIKLIADLMGYDGEIIRDNRQRKGDVFRHIGSNLKAYDVLGWEPTTSLEEGLQKTIEWYTSR
jgi:UDP-glucose 4-epimerase